MFKKILITLLSILLFFVLSITFLIQTEQVKKIVEHEISSFIEKSTGSPLKVQGLRLQFPLIAEVETISSEQFTLDHVYVKFSVWSLLRGDIVMRKLNVETMEVASQKASEFGITIKKLPHLHIDSLSIKELCYSGEKYVLDGEIHSGPSFSTALQIALMNDLQHPFYIALNGKESNTKLSAQFICKQLENFINGTLNLTEKQIALEDLQFDIKGIQGKGNIYLNDQKQWDKSTIILKINDLNCYSEMKGDAEIKVYFSGDFFTPQFEMKSLSQTLVLNEISFQNCGINAQGQLSDDSLKMTLQGNCLLNQNYLEGACKLLWDRKESIQVNAIQFLSENINGEGNCRIDLATHLIDGKLKGEFPNFHASYSLLFTASNEHKQCAQMTASSSGFVYSDANILNPHLSLSFENLFETPKGTLELFFESYDSEMAHLKHVQVETSIDLSQHVHPFALNSQFHKGFLQTNGFWNLNSVQIIDCSGEILDYPFHLKDAFLVSLDWNSWKTTPIDIYLNDGTISASISSKSDFMLIEAEIKKFPLQLLQMIPSAPRVMGDADLLVSVSGKKNSLEGSVTIHLADVEILEEIQPPLPPFNAKLEANLSNQSFSCHGEITGKDLNPIKLSGKLKDDQISMHFEAKDEITQFLQLLFFQNAVHLTGEASVQIDVEGTWNKPLIHGEVLWSNGTFEHPETGILYKQINGRLLASGNELFLNHIQAVDEKGGTLTGSGSMQLSSELHHPFSLDFLVKNTHLLDLDYATATGNGVLTLSGNVKEALLSGNIQADSINIRIPDETRPSIPSIAVSYINQSPTDVAPTTAYRSPNPWPIHLNLACEIKNPISIKGKNLTSTWNGNLLIKGSTESPLLYGDFKVILGEYNFRGKIFEIREGTIFFSGEKSTSLYVVGTQDIDDIQTHVILKGLLQSPALSFRSNPPMPQREIVSYILFGHSSSELTPFQGTELNESITDLDTTHTPDFLTRISEKIGIDKIDISSSDVKVGKYISKGVLLSIDKSMNAEANHVSIEAKVIKDIKFEGQIGDDAEGQLNIKWKKDY